MTVSARVITQLTVAAAVLLAGGALVNVGSKHRLAQRSQETERTLDRVRMSLEAEIAKIHNRATGASSESESSLVCWEPLADWGSAQPSRAWRQYFRQEADNLQRLRWPNLVGPYRAADGKLKILLRIPQTGGESEADRAPWCAAAVELEEILAESALRYLVESGYSYVLSFDDPVYREQWDLERAGDMVETPVAAGVDYTAGSWAVSVARAEPPSWRATFMSLGFLGIVLIAAVATARSYADQLSASRKEVLTAKEQRRRIRRRLLDEARHRRALDRQFTHAVYHDAPTGLPNNTFLVNRLERALQRIRVAGAGCLGILRLHPLRLETLAAACKHGSVDLILAETAQRVENCLRPSEVAVARSGADITILLFDLSGPQPAVAAAHRILEALDQKLDAADEPVYLTARIGIAFARTGFENPRELLREATIAATAGAAKPGAVQVFDATVGDELISLQQLDSDLRVALDRGEMIAYYQPIVSLETRSPVGFETLLRWKHPRLGVLTPDKFLEMAEDSGLITQVTRWLIRDACGRCRDWRRKLPSDRSFYLSVNLSPSDLREADLAEFVIQQIQEHSIPAELLRLEVTEGAVIENVEAASSLMNRLRSYGVAVMLDDFGAGYSSLGYLNRFRFDYLKLDRSFISRMNPENDSGRIVKAVLDLAVGLGMRVVAEGIEVAEAAEDLRRLGCEFGQGYLFGKPTPPADAFSMLDSEQTTKSLQRFAKAAADSSPIAPKLTERNQPSTRR